MFRFDELEAADPTPGMFRERAFELPILWSGRVTTQPGAVSGWHHHDRNESSLYVVRGVLRLEFEGFDGHLDAHAGDFVHVPAFTVHRESNPTDEPSHRRDRPRRRWHPDGQRRPAAGVYENQNTEVVMTFRSPAASGWWSPSSGSVFPCCPRPCPRRPLRRRMR